MSLSVRRVVTFIKLQREDIFFRKPEISFCGKSESEEDVGDFAREVDPCRALTLDEAQARVAAGESYVIRQRIPEGTTTFHDAVYGDITVDNAELDDQILLKSDGLPTYNFANVVDDHLMGITHVVRGNEYLSSSPKYNRLYAAFGWDVPVYVHCPLITDESHHKLSKRSGHSSFEAVSYTHLDVYQRQAPGCATC